MTLDAGDEELVRIGFRVLHKVRWRLFSGDGNEGNTLVGGLEPDDLGTLDRTTRLVTLVSFPLATLGFLLLLSRRRGRAEQTKRAGKQLTRHTLHDGDDMASILRLYIVCHPAQTR